MTSVPESVLATVTPIREHSIESAWEAAIKRMEEDEIVIRGLRKQNERLAAEKLNAELEASLEVAKHKFAAAQAFQKMKELQDRIATLEKESDRLNNFIAGHLVQRDQEYENLRANVSMLMGDFKA